MWEGSSLLAPVHHLIKAPLTQMFRDESGGLCAEVPVEFHLPLTGEKIILGLLMSFVHDFLLGFRLLWLWGRFVLFEQLAQDESVLIPPAQG